MNYSVVIPSRNVANLGPCIAAIEENEPDLKRERIIVVDDDETGKIKLFCQRNGLTRISGVKPFVYARNSNLGLRCALEVQGANGAVLLNDDTLLQSLRGFTVLSETAAANPDCGIIGVTTNVTGQPLQFRKNVGLRGVPEIAFVGVYIPRTTLDRVGLLDERYDRDYGVEDKDYCMAVRRAGLKIAVHDHCYVDHGSLTSSFRGDPKTPKSFQQNYALYKEKWGVTA